MLRRILHAPKQGLFLRMVPGLYLVHLEYRSLHYVSILYSLFSGPIEKYRKYVGIVPGTACKLFSQIIVH